MKKKKRFIVMTTTRMIMLGFLAAIVLGTILLSLPIATKERTVTPLVDALFTATTSICVTGLSTVSMAEHDYPFIGTGEKDHFKRAPAFTGCL